MNLSTSRGIENRLLRRVRRHQSMTALFRKALSPTERPHPARTAPAARAQAGAQDLPIQAPEPGMVPNVLAPVAAELVQKKEVSPPSEAVLQTAKVQASTSAPAAVSKPVSASQTRESNSPDPVWNRLQTIFRKHQEQNAAETADASAEKPILDPPLPSRVEEEQPPAPALTADRNTAGSVPPTPGRTIPGPANALVQRLPELKQAGSRTQNEAAPPSSMKESQAPAPGNQEPKMALHPADPPPPEHTPPLERERDAGPVATVHPLEQPPLQLQSAWNVQRMDVTHSPVQEASRRPVVEADRADSGERLSGNFKSMADQPSYAPASPTSILETDSLIEPEAPALPADPAPAAGRPAEILAPSRPRPPQANLPPAGASIQRQYQAPQMMENPDESRVSTVIGPLPADLWRLLGQKPPAATATPQVEAGTASGQKQPETPADSNHKSPPHAAVEGPVNHQSSSSETVQRQPLDHPLPLPASQQEKSSSTHGEKNKHQEADLDDLARRVYAEVKRRLTTEWERMR
jgi:hypothetical protein